jgi:hypothetical protein
LTNAFLTLIEELVGSRGKKLSNFSCGQAHLRLCLLSTTILQPLYPNLLMSVSLANFFLGPILW